MNPSDFLKWPRLRDLPDEERAPFALWLEGQTCPHFDGLPDIDQDGYYGHDYRRWREITKRPVKASEAFASLAAAMGPNAIAAMREEMAEDLAEKEAERIAEIQRAQSA